MHLPALWHKIMFLPYNFTLKKARQLVCNCWRILCIGMGKH